LLPAGFYDFLPEVNSLGRPLGDEKAEHWRWNSNADQRRLTSFWTLAKPVSGVCAIIFRQKTRFFLFRLSKETILYEDLQNAIFHSPRSGPAPDGAFDVHREDQ
jgi:hypothetical protein